MNQGMIVQCIGAVVDVEFPRDQIPEIYDALKLDEIGLTLEVQQQLGDGVVRTIALGSSDGLRRGMMVVNTKAPIMVPVGTDGRDEGGVRQRRKDHQGTAAHLQQDAAGGDHEGIVRDRRWRGSGLEPDLLN